IIISILVLYTYHLPTHNSTLSLHDALPIFIAHFLIYFTRSLCVCFYYHKRIRCWRWWWCFILFASVNSSPPTRRRGVNIIILSPDRKSTRLNSSHVSISYAVFCLKKKKTST